MAYIGKEPAEAFSSFQKQDFTTSATTSYTLDHPVANGNEIALFINFVRQEPTAAYTASGTSLTLTSATSSSDDMYCVYLGKAVQTVKPPNPSVGSSQVSADLITGQTALGATPADTDELLISDAGTLKRVDYSYLKPTNTPAFEARITTEQNPTGSTDTKINFDNEIFDTDGAYDTTNKRFTVPSGKAGKYHFYCDANMGSSVNSGLAQCSIFIFKNGSKTTTRSHFNTNADGNGRYMQVTLGATLDLAVGDYIEMYGEVVLDSGTGEIRVNESRFGAYKIIE